MTGRDRIVVMVIALVAVLAVVWLEVVSPQRAKASKLTAQVTEAKSQLSSAEGTLSSARAAKAQYGTAYAAIVNLGKAVPTSQEVPALIDQLATATGEKDVQFASITSGGAGTSSTAGATASATFTPMPFTFVFNGSYSNLEHLLQELTSFANRSSSGTLEVSGRLLTVQSVRLGPLPSKGHPGELTASISATAYVLPAQGAASAATPASPTGAATPAATSTTSTSTPAPAIVKVTP
jgi:Tfp pilus assembly protein PilO